MGIEGIFATDMVVDHELNQTTRPGGSGAYLSVSCGSLI